MNTHRSRNPNRHASWPVSLTLAYCLLFAPILGCGDSQPTDSSSSTAASDSENEPMSLTDSALQGLSNTWTFITETTESGLTIVSEKCAAGTKMVLNAGNTAWIWTADTTADGWNWIVENAGDATEWAADKVSRTWAVTRQKTGEFSLWVKVKAKNGIAWAKTALPAAWKVTKDTAGKAWVWIGEHKVEIAVAAAVVTVVVAGLIIAPEAVAPSVVRGAVAGTSAQATQFLMALWNDRENSEHKAALGDVSHDMFMSIGKSVLSQCGTQILDSVQA